MQRNLVQKKRTCLRNLINKAVSVEYKRKTVYEVVDYAKKQNPIERKYHEEIM